jgi:hypothetical protein
MSTHCENGWESWILPARISTEHDGRNENECSPGFGITEDAKRLFGELGVTRFATPEQRMGVSHVQGHAMLGYL